MKLFPPSQFRISQKSEFQVCLEILYEESMGEHSWSKLTNFDFYKKIDTNKKKIQKNNKKKIQTGKSCSCRQFGHHTGTSCNLPASSYHIMAETFRLSNFAKTRQQQMINEYCIDLDSIHQTGVSNGGMFSYHTAAHMDWWADNSNLTLSYLLWTAITRLIRFATIGPVAAAPFVGYGEVMPIKNSKNVFLCRKI